MPTGTITVFNAIKGFGFLVDDDSNETHFMHFSAAEGDGFRFSSGDKVTFESIDGAKGKEAIDIKPL